MSDLREFQHKFVEAVFGPESPSDPALALYRSMTRHAFRESVERIFPVTRTMLSARDPRFDWDAVLDRLLADERSRGFCVNRAVRELPSALRLRAKSQDWIRELAEYEWARHEALTARDARMGEWLNPSLVLRRFRFPIAQWYGERAEKAPRPRASNLVVFRHPDSERVHTLELHEAAFELLVEWVAGQTPVGTSERVAREVGRPAADILAQLQPLLASLISQRIVLTG